MICGVWPVIEALRAGKNVEKLLIRREAGGDGIREIRQLAMDRQVPWQPVPVEKLDRLTRTEHQGVIALFDENFIKTNLLPKELGKLFHRAFDMRQSGDCRDMLVVTEQQAIDAVNAAERFISAIEEKLSS